jgi:AcrR family transcriptional regulator
MSAETTTRKYEQKVRAEQQEETRLRITVAAMELHGSLGPAKTSIKAVADRAGVQRATVYRYFKNDDELFAACSNHWLALNPPPDISVWTAETNPESRTLEGLAELYDHYGRTAEMMANIIRDESLHPAVPPLIASYWQFLELATDALMKGRGLRGRKAQRTRAAARLAVDFSTWHRLVEREGLDSREAAEVMTRAVAQAS